MDTFNTRPSWLAALLPLLAFWQYGDRDVVRGELYRMALSADAAAQSSAALNQIVRILDDDGKAIEDRLHELRSIVCTALLKFEQLPPSAPVAITLEHKGRLQ